MHYNGDLNIQSPAVGTGAINGISYIARNCRSKNGRESMAMDLMKAGIRVDALGVCLHNKDWTEPQDNNFMYAKIPMMRPYKFHAAFENGDVRDYVTEKVYLA